MDDRIPQLKAALATVMRRDRTRLMRRLEQAVTRLKREQPADRMLEGIAADLKASADLRQWRADHLPKPEFPDNLPVAARRDDIAAALAENQVIVVAGETGSGKTTQLPKICLAAGRGVEGMIGHTQPRRIAARSLAARIGEELGDPAGTTVGHKVRFADHTRPETFVKVMTDGILLAEARSDRLLAAYDTIIVDEAHERSLNIDFLLGYLKNLLPRRPDLKVIVTSATIDTARFAEHFNAPVVEVTGRTYPVEVRYRPLEGDDGTTDMATGILNAVDEIAAESTDGDMLVFLPGERDIRETADALRKHHPEHTEIVPLYARLSASEQARVFHPGSKRRIVLATNVAETSLTVPRIHYVIDPGTARISRYSPRARVQRLPIEKISQASANQRKGRCGRIASGVCIRLYSGEDFAKRDEFTEPEIRRTNLAAVILRMLELNLGDIGEFPFVEPPDRRQIADGYALLSELGAVDGRRELTPMGRRMAGFHVDPRLARMILAADQYHALREMLVITAFLSVQDPRERPADQRTKADQAHAKWKHERSDFMAALNLWDWYHEQARHLSQSKLRKLCKESFLSFIRMREWHDLERELANQVKEMGLRPNQEPATYDEIHKSLLSGLLGHMGLREEKREYRAARDGRFLLFPGSGLIKGNKSGTPPWLMAAEVVETEQRYARTCAAIQPEWAVEVGDHLVKRSWSDPRWEKKRGAVVATERATLYGLPVQPGKTVQYGHVNPGEAREWFIRAALIPGELNSPAPFLAHNRGVLEQLEEATAKSRDRGLGVDPERLFAFFDARLPAGISDIRAFDRWRKEAERKEPRLLYLDADDLGARDALPPDLFPDHLDVAGQSLPLSYRFRLGHPKDGVTVTVPLAMLGGLTPEAFGWLVPGLLRDKVGHLLRTLPKQYRKRFMPWPHWAGRFADAVPPGGDLIATLTGWLQAESRVTVPADGWDVSKLPEHLKMRFRVVDTGGRELAAGRDLGDLQEHLGGAARTDFRKLPKGRFEKSGLTEWADDLPEQVALSEGVTGFPALTDEGASVAVRLYGSAAEADAHHRRGLLKLAELQMGKAFRQLTRAAVPQNAALQYAALGGPVDLRGDALNAALEHLFQVEKGIRDRAAFEARLDHVQRHLTATLAEAITCAGDALAEWHPAVTALKATARGGPESLTDIREHLSALIHPGFVSGTPFARLPHLPRFLKGVNVRIRKMNENPARDAARLGELLPLLNAWSGRVTELKAAALDIPREVAEFRWLLEELRISLFAQEIKTAVPVSLQRLTRMWEEISR
ncbi:MAG: ATP-dependent RNA helicase HrpA [Nitrospirota bacterium]|nr:ATP-dependent RNA helicase HrpA [Nitrospirota bacterium]